VVELSSLARREPGREGIDANFEQLRPANSFPAENLKPAGWSISTSSNTCGELLGLENGEGLWLEGSELLCAGEALGEGTGEDSFFNKDP